MTIILDNGHGAETAGKRSPIWNDKTQLFEWEFNRDVVKRIATRLDNLHIDYKVIVPETNDISLSTRVRRANVIAREKGAGNCLLISVHANAGGGTGWEAYTTRGKTNSDDFATILYAEAEKMWGKEWRIRKDMSDGDPDKEADFYIIKKVICPAVLVENFFMDTEKDCRYIMSDEGREKCADVIVNAVKIWINGRRS